LIPHKSNLGADDSVNWQEGIPIATGITGQVVRTGKAIRIGDSTKEQNYIEPASGIKSEACVPFWVHDRIIGVFNVESKLADAYDEEDERFLNTLAGGLGTALEKLRLFKTEQTQRQRETAILELIRTAASSLDLNQVLQSILDQLIKVVPSDSGTIQLLEGDHLNILATFGTEKIGFVKRGLLMLSEFPLNNYIVTEKRIARIDNVLLDDRYQYFPETSNVRSFLGIPLIVNDKTIGMIALDSYQIAHYTEQDAELGLVLAGHASIAIENARMFEVEQIRRKQAEILREATAALTTTIELDKLFEIIFDSLAELVPYDSMCIEMINQGYFEIVAGRGIPIELLGKKYPADLEKWGGVDKLRQPLIIPDVRVDDRYLKFDGLEYIVGWMGIYLFAQGKLIGCLNLDSKTPGFFNEEHAAIAQTFANQAAIAIENARLFREENRRSQIIEALADIANEIATTREEISSLDKIAERTLSLLNASSVAVYLLQDDNKTIKIVSAQGEYQKELISHTIQIGEGVTGNIIANGKSEIIADTINDLRSIRIPGTSEKNEELDTMMSAPLILHGKSVGAINAWRLKSQGLFDASELNFLVSIAHQASILIESVRLFDEITRRAQEAAAIVEVGRNISATLELNIVLERIAAYAKDLLRAETSAVYLTEPNSPLLRAVSAIGVDVDEIKNDPLLTGTGILGNIALQKHGEIVNDTKGDPRSIIIKRTEAMSHEHIMGVPVLSKNQLTGLLVVWRTGIDNEFKVIDLDFLSSLAQQAAIAIENARLFEEEQKRRQEAENLQVAATVITSSLDPQEVLETILVALKQVVPYDSASIFLLEGNQARITAAKGLPNMEMAINQIFPATNVLTVAIVETLQPVILEDAQEDERFENWANAEAVHGWMGIPLIARGKAIGYITLDSHTPAAFDLHSAFLAQTFAHQASAAIENARLYAETRRRLEEQEVISQISISLRAAKNPSEMLYLILDQVLKAMDTDTASIWLYDPGKDELVQSEARGQF
ncbi:MAG: GAF domain-containing protein, partial [Anaerolineales bacterium]|nr:GAF domain-containing protein [Anaerolineales bacterium]